MRNWIAFLGLLMWTSLSAAADEKANEVLASDAETAVEKAIEDADYGDDDAIIVTATRSGRRTFDIPQAVTVLDRETVLTVAPFVGLKSISRRAAGIWYDERTFSTTDPIIRGFAGFNLLSLVDGNTLSTLWGEGGFGSDDMFGKVDVETIERIEVIRGPQSALYGSNALGGVINVITRDSPIDYTESGLEWGGRTKVDYTSAAEGWAGRLELHGATPFVKVLAGVSYRDTDDVTGGRGLGVLSPTSSEELNWDLATEFKVGDARFVRATFQSVNRDPTFRYYRPTQDNRNTRRAVALTYRDETEGAFWDELELRCYYQIKEDRRHFYTDATRTVLARAGTATTETYQGGARIVKKLGGGHLVTAGVTFELDDADSPDDEQFTFTFPGPKRRDAPLSVWTNYAGYVQDEWEINDWLTLTGTVRFDAFDFETDVDGAYVPPIGDPMNDEIHDTSSAFTGGLGAVVRLSPELRLVGSYARGFRQSPPNFGIRQLGDGVLIPNALLDPTTSDNFELGLKGRYDGLSFELFGYYSMIQNWQGDLRPTTFNGSTFLDLNGNSVQDANEGYVTQVEGGDAYVAGIEARVDWRPNAHISSVPNNWSLWGSFAWNEGEIDASSSHPMKEPFRHTQPMRGLVGLRWDDTQNPSRGLFFELVADMVGRFDDIPSDRQNSDLAWRRDPQDGSSPHLRSYIGTPGYTLFHAYAGVNLCETTRLRVALENLTNRRHRAAHSRMDGPGFNLLVSLEVRF